MDFLGLSPEDLNVSQAVANAAYAGETGDSVLAVAQTGGARAALVRVGDSGWGHLVIGHPDSGLVEAGTLVDLAESPLYMHGARAKHQGEGPSVHFALVKDPVVSAVRIRLPSGSECYGAPASSGYILAVISSDEFLDDAAAILRLKRSSGWSAF